MSSNRLSDDLTGPDSAPPQSPPTLPAAVRLAWSNLAGLFSDEHWSEGVGFPGRLAYTGAVLGQLLRSQVRCRRGWHNWVPGLMSHGVLESVTCHDCEISVTPAEWFELI